MQVRSHSSQANLDKAVQDDKIAVEVWIKGYLDLPTEFNKRSLIQVIESYQNEWINAKAGLL